MTIVQSEVVLFSSYIENWKLPKFKHAEGDDKGRGKKEGSQDSRGGKVGHST